MSRRRGHTTAVERVEREMTKLFDLHGKTVTGSMAMGDRAFALDFDDGTHLWIDGAALRVEYREEPL